MINALNSSPRALNERSLVVAQNQVNEMSAAFSHCPDFQETKGTGFTLNRFSVDVWRGGSEKRYLLRT